MAWWQEFHFLRWYWLLALVLPLWMVFKASNNIGVQSSWAKVCDENLLNYLLVKGKNQQRRRPFLLASLLLFLAVISFAGPTWHKKNNPSLSVDNPVMLVLNMSTDMLVKDVAPSRLVRAKYVIKDLLNAFQNTETGLLVYSREPFVITPLTEDVSLIDNLLDAADMDIIPENGDRLDRAVNLAMERMKSAGYPKGNIVVVTADVGERFDAALESVATAHAGGFQVHIVKVSAQDNEKLKMVADKGEGAYLNYNESLRPLTDFVNDITNKELSKSRNLQAVWEDMGYYLFWLPALLLLYYFRRGVLLTIALMVLAARAEAGWFLNNNQEGMRYFENQQYEEAAAKFEDVQWRGAAAYKSGDYQKALQDFMQRNDTTSLYNQGNALAKSGKIAEAIAKYEEVLKQDADFEDARFNLEYLKKQQQQQKQQNEQKKQQKKEQQQQQQQQSQEKQEDKKEQDEQQQERQQQDQQSQQEEQQKERAGADHQQEQQQNGKQEPQQHNNSNERNEEGAQQPQSQAQNSDSEQQQEASGNKDVQQGGTSSSQGNSEKREEQDAATDNQNQNGDDDSVEITQQARYGNEDEQSDDMAKALETQAGAKSSEDEEKIRVRLQKFREIKEDKGGLLRSFIQKEYNKRRYKGE